MAVNWQMGIAPDIIGNALNAFEQGKQMRRVEASRNALATLVQNPTDKAAFGSLAQNDPGMAVQFQDRQSEMARAQQDAEAKKREVALGQIQLMGKLLSGVTDEASYQRGIAAAQQLGLDTSKAPPSYNPSWVEQQKFIVTKTLQDAQFTLAPGSKRFDEAGNLIAEAPFAPHYSTVSEGQTVVRDQPGTTGPVSAQTFLPAIVAQESGGNYSAVNKESGALGAYQVMPATGQSLAQRLGLPWRPDLMTSSTPEAKQYQDKIGQAAVQEALQASGGDPVKAAMYYHGGSDQSKWGPRTRQYAREVVGRLGNGATVVASGPPKQEKPKDAPAGYRWKPDGTLEPIPGGPADKPGAGGNNNPAYSQSAIDAFNRAIDSGNRLLTHPGLEARVGVKGVTGGLLGGWVVPGTDAADFNAELDAMKAQVFLPMVQSMKGMGALSNAEGEKLTAAIGALNPNMSEGAFKASLKRIIGDLTTYRDRGAPKAAPAPSRQAPKSGPRPTVSNW